MHFADKIKMTVDGKICRVSIRINEETVIVKTLPVDQVQKVIADFNAQVKEQKK